MTVDESKELLEQLQDQKRLIHSIQTALAENAGFSLPSGQYITGKEKLEAELVHQLDLLIGAEGQVITAILGISDIRFRTILLEHYINGKEWPKIAEQFEVARQTVCKKWLGPALEEFTKNMERTVKTDAE